MSDNIDMLAYNLTRILSGQPFTQLTLEKQAPASSTNTFIASSHVTFHNTWYNSSTSTAQENEAYIIATPSISNYEYGGTCYVFVNKGTQNTSILCVADTGAIDNGTPINDNPPVAIMQIMANAWNGNNNDIVLISANMSASNGIFVGNGSGNPNIVFTANMTIDNDAGITIGNGYQTNATAQSSVTVGTSPYTYTNTSASNQEVLIYGGTITAITFTAKGGTAIDMNITLSSIVLRVGDALTITYSTAPTISTIQL